MGGLRKLFVISLVSLLFSIIIVREKIVIIIIGKKGDMSDMVQPA